MLTTAAHCLDKWAQTAPLEAPHLHPPTHLHLEPQASIKVPQGTDTHQHHWPSSTYWKHPVQGLVWRQGCCSCRGAAAAAAAVQYLPNPQVLLLLMSKSSSPSQKFLAVLIYDLIQSLCLRRIHHGGIERIGSHPIGTPILRISVHTRLWVHSVIRWVEHVG